jgi:hypothetical protein
MFSCTITPKSINLYLPGDKPYTVDKTHVNYGAIRDHLRIHYDNREGARYERWVAHLRDLLNPKTAIARKTAGRVQVKDQKIYFDGVEVKSVLAERIVAMLADGFDIQPLVRFMDRLMSNPTVDVRDDLYLWLENSKLPITEDGCFLAYKYVRHDYKSVHDGETDNSIGTIVSMPRDLCDPYRSHTCSSGLHFCSLDYLTGSHLDFDCRIVVLKIDPADVVAIPHDYNNQKGRACRYAVIDEIARESLTSIEAAATDAIGTYDDSIEDDFEAEIEESVPTPALKVLLNTPAPWEVKERAEEGFSHGGKVYTAAQIKDLLLVHGQRGTSRALGIPRTTLQDWAKRIEAGNKKAARKAVSKVKKALKKQKKAAKREARRRK